MSNFWIATDFHLGHKKMLEVGRKPGYEQKILKALSRIPDTDTLIFLGDFCIGGDAKWHHELNQFWFRKWMIRGNHDRKSMSWYLEHGWDVVCDSLELNMYGKKILFTHRPRSCDFCIVNVHGHTHGNGTGESYTDPVDRSLSKHILATEYPQTLRSIYQQENKKCTN